MFYIIGMDNGFVNYFLIKYLTKPSINTILIVSPPGLHIVYIDTLKPRINTSESPPKALQNLVDTPKFCKMYEI